MERNGVRLLDGPVGGGCAMTSRELNERVGGFREDKKQVFWLEDAAYVEDIQRLGFRAAVLADLRVHHTGGAYYGAISAEKSDVLGCLLEEAGAACRDQEACVPAPVLRPSQRALQLVRRALLSRPSRSSADASSSGRASPVAERAER